MFKKTVYKPRPGFPPPLFSREGAKALELAQGEFSLVILASAG